MIKWFYRYVGKGEQIFNEDAIITTTDKHGRWAIIAYVEIKTSAMPGYEPFGKTVPVKIAWINQRIVKDELWFESKFSFLKDANIGYGEANLANKNLRELMKEIEEKFLYTVNAFKNIKKPKQ